MVLSDDAGQFDVGEHVLCWAHAERLVHKLGAFIDQHRTSQQYLRGLICWFYADLKAYCDDPTPRQGWELRARFDRIFLRTTGFVTLDRLLQRLAANKAELLMVLDHPEIALNINGALSWPDRAVVHQTAEKITNAAMVTLFEALLARHPTARAINVVVDNASYNGSADIKA